jgi:hypothetical protein
MAKKFPHVRIDSGELPSARGVKEGYRLSEVIAQWQHISHGRFRDDCSALKQMIRETEELRLWEKNVGGFTFKNRDEFLRKKVLIDFELTEHDMIEIVALLKCDDHTAVQRRLAQKLAANPAVPALATHAEAGAKGGRGKKAPDNVSIFGNSATYLVRRLKRDHPEIAEALARGEFKSARAAGRAAGIVKAPPSPLAAAQKAYLALIEADKRSFREWIAVIQARNEAEVRSEARDVAAHQQSHR